MQLFIFVSCSTKYKCISCKICVHTHTCMPIVKMVNIVNLSLNLTSSASRMEGKLVAGKDMICSIYKIYWQLPSKHGLQFSILSQLRLCFSVVGEEIAGMQWNQMLFLKLTVLIAKLNSNRSLMSQVGILAIKVELVPVNFLLSVSFHSRSSWAVKVCQMVGIQWCTKLMSITKSWWKLKAYGRQ